MILFDEVLWVWHGGGLFRRATDRILADGHIADASMK